MKTVKIEYIVRYYGEKIWSKEYRLNGKLHRENGIAYKSWYDNGNKHKEIYCIEGLFHRENEIAYKDWHKNGNVWNETYYLNGEYLTKKEFDNRIIIVIKL